MLDFDPSGFKHSDTWTQTVQKMNQGSAIWIFRFTAYFQCIEKMHEKHLTKEPLQRYICNYGDIETS